MGALPTTANSNREPPKQESYADLVDAFLNAGGIVTLCPPATSRAPGMNGAKYHGPAARGGVFTRGCPR